MYLISKLGPERDCKCIFIRVTLDLQRYPFYPYLINEVEESLKSVLTTYSNISDKLRELMIV